MIVVLDSANGKKKTQRPKGGSAGKSGSRRGGEGKNNPQLMFNSIDDEGSRRVDIDMKHDIRSEIFGDSTKKKDSDTVRFLFANINGLPNFNGHCKNDLIYDALAKHKVDIAGFTEVNKNWKKIKLKHGWKSRTRRWWENSHSSIAFNTKDNGRSPFQPGGNIMHSIGKSSFRVIESGYDDMGLGRWSWTRYRGKHDVTMTVITGYRPCKPVNNLGANTVYAQQKRYFDFINDTRCPRDAVLEDVSTFIIGQRKKNDQIVVMMDFNEDIHSPRIQKWAKDNDIQESIHSQHGGEKPATYHRGKKQIDGVFCSKSIVIQLAGFLAFGDLPTDHRAGFFDITFANAFGYNMSEIETPAARRLKSNDPTVRNRWLDLYKKYLVERGVMEQMFEIEENMEIPLPRHLAKEYDKLLEIRKEAIDYADKNCRKLRMGQVPYSPEVKTAGMKISLWKGVITKKSGCKYSTKKIRRMANQLNIKNPMKISKDLAQKNLDKAWEEYKEKKKEAAELQKQYLEKKAKAIAEELDEDEKNIYKELIEREEIRESFRRIKFTLNKLRGGGVTRVEVEEEDGSLTEITTKKGIEKAGLKENEAKYSQTNRTPCMVEPLKSLLGFDGNTEAGREILNGEFVVPEEVDNPYAQEFFDHLERANILHPAGPACISTDDFIEGWKIMKEKTSAGISGLQFGHLKACAMDKTLAEFEAALTNIPYATGYVPFRWKNGISVMIHKKAHVDLITKLRTITLLEADFNFNNKLLGGRTLQHAEKNNLIPKEQYGSRNNKSAIQHAIHKKLTYDLIRQHRSPGALCSNDAKSCFDRIVHSVACLAYERLGIDQPPVHGMIHTIQQMKHFVRTTYGDSQMAIDSNGMVKPFQGVLQGNDASPATWVIVSTALIEMMRSAGNGGHFVSPISKEESHIIGYAFVDDTDLVEVDMRDRTVTIDQTLRKMQETVDRWEGGLKMTGGAIVPAKSWVYPIDFEFDQKGRWRYKTVEEINHPFTVKDHSNERQVLKSVDPDVGKETLGVVLALDGNNEDLKKELTKKTTEWAEFIKTGHLNRDDVMKAFDCTIMASLKYPLQAATLTEKECKDIIAPVLDVALPRSAISRKFPRDALYGTKSEHGFGKTNLYDHSGVSKIAVLYEHINAKTMTGDLIRASIEAAKVEIGIGRDLFSLDFKKFGHLCTDSFVKYIWEYAWNRGISIEEKVTKNLILHRENDVFLMEDFGECGFTKREMKQINICRLYLQVTTYSDITNGSGDKIADNITRGEKNTQHLSKYVWPRQERPADEEFRVWRTAIRRAFHKMGITQILEYKLGKWTHELDDWRWFYKPTSQTLYQRQENGQWRIFKRRTRRGRMGVTPQMIYSNQAVFRPLHTVPATVTEHSDTICTLTGWKEYVETADMTEETDDETIEDSHMEPHYENDSEVQREALAQSIRDKQAKFVGDGSFCPNQKKGTAAFICESPGPVEPMPGSVVVPGNKSVQNSTRSELTGILAILIYILRLQKDHDLSGGKIEIGCDGLAALKAIWKCEYNKTVKPKAKYFDLLHSILQCMERLTTPVEFRHVKGHQDDNVTYEKLDQWAQLNVIVDRLAKLWMEQHRLEPKD